MSYRALPINVELLKNIYLASLDIDPEKAIPSDVAYLQGLIESSIGIYFKQEGEK